MPIAPREKEGSVSHGDLDALYTRIKKDLLRGRLPAPQLQPTRPNLAGGQNHCPNSDLSYSTLAATTAGTTSATAGDTNHEAYKFYRQQVGANITVAASNALKASGHSLYAANEGATAALPDWDRVNGWVRIGASGATQYDIAAALLSRVVGPGQRWFVRMKLVALNAALVPADLQVYAGIWHKHAAGEGYIEGSAFNLSHVVKGTAGATSIDYRVLAKTDSGVQILSNVLNVPNANAALSTTNYVQLYFNPGPGFLEFEIYKLVGGVYYHIFTIRNSSDLQYNDTGIVAKGVVAGWPAEPQNKPKAYAETRNVLIGAFGGLWQANDLTIEVPAAYDFSQTTEQFLRIGLTAAAGVDRHIGIDRIWFSTNYAEWAPDPSERYASGASVSPTQGLQGAGGGVFEPPPGGGGGRTCVVVKTPIKTGRAFKSYQGVKIGQEVKGEERLPYVVLDKKHGMVSEYYEIKTSNGITLECSVDHQLALSLFPRRRIEARQVKVGTRLACEVRGRKTFTTVKSIRLIPRPAEVGTFTLGHTGGLHRDGDGMYIAGQSRTRDRGLFCFNLKSFYES